MKMACFRPITLRTLLLFTTLCAVSMWFIQEAIREPLVYGESVEKSLAKQSRYQCEALASAINKIDSLHEDDRRAARAHFDNLLDHEIRWIQRLDPLTGEEIRGAGPLIRPVPDWPVHDLAGGRYGEREMSRLRFEEKAMSWTINRYFSHRLRMTCWREWHEETAGVALRKIEKNYQPFSVLRR
ncbi:MAG: hypothetical protein AAF989_07250 [Planctomycetota bacterium]